MDRIDVRELLREAMEHDASDLHLTVEAPPTIRVNGELRQLPRPPLSPAQTGEIAAQLMSEDQRGRFAQNGEADFSYGVPGFGRFRVNAFRQRGSVGLAIRVIPPRIRTSDELGLPPIAGQLIAQPHGLLIVTGPTGSGKSTTLASLIDQINRERSCHIVTLEDPIEYLHRHQRSLVNQREVGIDTHGFGEALRAALRQDPDVLMVGEMRDLETVSTALVAAETGHLVMASLHTGTAPQAVERIVDLFPAHQQAQARLQLASVLLGVIAQQLIPRQDGAGRALAAEVLVGTVAVRNLIREGKTHQLLSLMQAGAQSGMQTMEAAVQRLWERGAIPAQEYRARTVQGALSAPNGAPRPGAAR